MKLYQTKYLSLEKLKGKSLINKYEESNMKLSEFLAVSALITSLGGIGLEAAVKADSAVNQAQSTIGNLQDQQIWQNAQACALDKLVSLGLTTQAALEEIATNNNPIVVDSLKECVSEIIGIPTNTYSGMPVWLQEALNAK
jgi:hypothetical protein